MLPSTMPLISATVLHSDENLLILNKHPGISVIPGRGDGRVLSLREHAERYAGGKLFVVHRIDHETSGIVVFCRNAAAHRSISLQFERRIVKKEYHAVVMGTMEGSGEIDAPIFPFGSGRMGVHEKGKPSRTCFEVREKFDEATLLSIVPVTGRRHQIRVHCYHLGHPVLGDRLYGQQRPVGGIERLMLHAASITFAYPHKNDFTVTAPVDENWSRIVQGLRSGREMR
ncbi:MAG: RluA family pseudouridine synthase [Chitinispirillaceae bacterium]|nr:RluA family pseudouridine synthase [Chitinispirillaceae bacterium]